jgi:hypothetical protein
MTGEGFLTGAQRAVWDAAEAVSTESVDWICGLHVEGAVVDVLLQTVDRLGSDATPALIAHRDGSVRLTADEAADMVYQAARVSEEHALAGERLRGEKALGDLLGRVLRLVTAMGAVMPWVGEAPAGTSLEDLAEGRPSQMQRMHAALGELERALDEVTDAMDAVVKPGVEDSPGVVVPEVPTGDSEVDRLRRQRDELLAACEAFSAAGVSSWGVPDPAYPNMVACPGCMVVSSRDAEKHTQNCTRLAARVVAQKIRAEVSRG